MSDGSDDGMATSAIAGTTAGAGPSGATAASGYAEARRAVADPARLAAVLATGLLDTEAEAVFDRLTRLAVRLVGVPAAFLSLVDERRDFYKSACGFGEPLATARELTGPTFCHYTIRSAAPLVIPDTAADPVYRDVPTVHTMGVAAYVGIPLVVNGQALGSFCAIDTRPREWTADELEVLSELAASAQREVELRVALRAAETGNARATGVLEAMADAYFALDADFRIAAVNAAMERNVGLSREVLVGRSMWEAFPGTVGNVFEQSYRRAAEEGHASHYTHDYSDGRLELVTEVDVYPAEGGGAAVFWRDVTERVRTEAALRESEARFRVMADAVPQIVWITDPEGRTEFLNAQWTAYTGEAFEPSTAAAVAAAVVHPDDGSATVAAFDEARRTGAVLTVEHRLRSAQGEYRWFLVRAQPYRDLESGEIVRWFAVSVDIHDRKLAEAERARVLQNLQQSDAALRYASAQLAERTAAAEAAQLAAKAAQLAAEEANRAKTAFLSAMSHELRTPLNAIGGYAELLALGVRGPVSEAQRTDLERLLRANQHMAGLVTTVLDFARVEAGQVEYRLEAVPLGPLLQDVEALVGPQLEAKGLAYDHDGCGVELGTTPPTVRADPEKLRQILLNLLTNAVKFTDAPGRVTLVCEGPDKAGMVRVRVTDTGRGIPADKRERIFEPFVQVDRHRTPANQQGVGLGLAISRDLARGMGGDLTVDSTPGVGSAFTLRLPGV